MTRVTKPLLIAIIVILSIALTAAVRQLRRNDEDDAWLRRGDDRPRVISIVNDLAIPPKAQDVKCPGDLEAQRCFLTGPLESELAWAQMVRSLAGKLLQPDGPSECQQDPAGAWACLQAMRARGSTLKVVLSAGALLARLPWRPPPQAPDGCRWVGRGA